MRRFQFRLQPVLTVKEQRERLAEMRQRQAQARHEEARAECARLEEEIIRTASAASARLRESARLGTWQAHSEQAAALGDMLDAAKRRADECEKQLQEANRLRIQAALEVEALRALWAREWADYQKEANRLRQNNLDELGLRRWLAARDAGPFGSPDAPEGGES